MSYATIQRLRRLLLLLPVVAHATRQGRGLPLSRAVKVCGARSERQVREDVAAVAKLWTETGSPDDIVNLYVEDGALFAEYATAFQRPSAFSLVEGAALRSVLAPFEQTGSKTVEAAARKLLRAVPEPLRPVADALARGLDLPGQPPGPWAAALQQAIDQRLETTLEYRAVADADATRRVVEPRVLFQGGNGEWYLAAWNVEKKAEHLFRLDRIVSVEPGMRVFGGHQGPPVARYQGRNLYFQSGAERDVTLRFTGLAARIAKERPSARVEERADGGVSVKLHLTPGNYLLSLVLGHGGEATVEAPADVAEALKAIARDLLALYR